WRVLVSRQSYRFRSIPTCCAIPVATSSPTRDTTLGHCSTTSGTRTFSTPCATRSLRRIASRTSGGIEESSESPMGTIRVQRADFWQIVGLVEERLHRLKEVTGNTLV